MAQYKTLAQLAKAYKDGGLSKKSKVVVEDGTAKVSAVPVDKKSKKAIAGAAPEVVFEACAGQLLKDALKLAGVPMA